MGVINREFVWFTEGKLWCDVFFFCVSIIPVYVYAYFYLFIVFCNSYFLEKKLVAGLPK